VSKMSPMVLVGLSMSRPDRLIDVEGREAVVPKIGIIGDRAALFPHSVGPKARIGAEEVVIHLALPHVLRWCFVQSAGRVRLPRNGRRLH
jgi:hypothetical protein